jgi:hypothetical protein
LTKEWIYQLQSYKKFSPGKKNGENFNLYLYQAVLIKKLIMKLKLIVFINIITLTLVAFLTNPGYSQNKMGAKSAEDLSDVLFTALKRNSFDNLNNYTASQEQISYLIKTASDKNRPYFESLNPEQIDARLRKGFEDITRKGIVQNINWNEVELIDYKTRSCNIELIGCNVSFTIQDQNDKKLLVTYDAVKVNDRWFIFQNLGLGKD